MSVALLFCEGVAQSADLRVLSSVLFGVVGRVEPREGKDGLPLLVMARRDLQDPVTRSCCAIADGDFPREPDQWRLSNDAKAWTDKKKNRIGWLWQRKEIENYLIDPVVLTRVFRWSDTQREGYERHLRMAWERASVSTAARMALTCLAPGKGRLGTGIAPGTEPDRVLVELQKRAEQYNRENRIDAAELEERWRKLMVDCSPGGRFFDAAATVFAGKDVLAVFAGMQGLQALDPRLKLKEKLIEKVLQTMEEDGTPHEWLPEWRSLRAAVSEWSAAG